MAFKFQVGSARLSGSTTFEEAVTGLGEVKGNTLVSDSTVSGSGALQGASVAVDGTVTGGTLVSNGTISGSATISGGAVTTNGALTGGKLVVGSADMSEADLEQLDGITAGTAAASKALVLDSSSNISGINNVGAAQLSASAKVLAGGAISGSGGLQVGGTVEFYDALSNSNAILFHTGDGVLKDSANLTFDGSNVLSGSGDARFGGTLRVDNGATLGGTVEFDVAEVTVDQTADFVFFRDSDGAVKRTTVVSFVNQIAGAGTAASNGQITVAGAGAFPLSDADHNLSGGINYFSGSLTAARTVTLPAAASDYAGVHFIVKAAANTSNTLTITISPQSGERIDGVQDNDVILESPGAAVTLVGVGASGWAII